jgi:hypothetical protein
MQVSAMKSNSELTAKFTGIIVFLIGIGLLLFVFRTAYGLFGNPVPELSQLLTNVSHARPNDSAANAIAFRGAMAALVVFFLKSIMLLACVVAGSIISVKGLHLYFAAASSQGSASATAAEPKSTSRGD